MLPIYSDDISPLSLPSPLPQLHYIHSAPGGSGSTNPPVLSTVYGYVGTPPAQRQLSSLVWRLGPSHFLEEVLPATSVAAIYELGPNYVGSFQAVYLPCEWSSWFQLPVWCTTKAFAPSFSDFILVDHLLCFLFVHPL